MADGVWQMVLAGVATRPYIYLIFQRSQQMDLLLGLKGISEIVEIHSGTSKGLLETYLGAAVSTSAPIYHLSLISLSHLR